MLESSEIKEKDKKAGIFPVLEVPLAKKLYPVGKPLRLEEREWPKLHRPKSVSAGEYLRWGYCTHSGSVVKMPNAQKANAS